MPAVSTLRAPSRPSHARGVPRLPSTLLVLVLLRASLRGFGASLPPLPTQPFTCAYLPAGMISITP